VFWRVAVGGHSPTEIAAELGVTQAAVRKTKSRILRRLREEAGERIA
jgi:DNA-directed RNA polymerase specialized sigma24 family protein